MSDSSTQASAAGIAPPPQPRQVFTPRTSLQRRTGLLVLGVVLVVATALAFWLILDSVDTRQNYLAASRDISRWDVITRADFAVVEANVGDAAAIRATNANVNSLTGRWALGRIPQGTILTGGMFGAPPLSGENDAGKVLIEVTLPEEEAPFDYLEAGEKIALIGSERDPDAGPDAEQSDAALIGMLELEDVDGGIFYVVTPEEAATIERIVSRYNESSDRRIWKLSPEVTREQVSEVLGPSPGLAPPLDQLFEELAPEPVPSEEPQG